MTSDAAQLLGLLTVLFVSTLLACLAPLWLTLSTSRTEMISTFSVGLLVGAVLSVVIPEGVETVYEGITEENKGHVFTWMGLSLLGGFLTIYLIEGALHGGHDEEAASEGPLTVSEQSRRSTPHLHKTHSTMTMPGTPTEETLEGDDSSATFLLDEATRAELSRKVSCSRYVPFSSSDVESLEPPSHPVSVHHGGGRHHHHHTGVSPNPLAITLGLVIHASADGLSLGAASSSLSTSSYIVFFAIILHKLPTAFALSSLLLSIGKTDPAAFSTIPGVTLTARYIRRKVIKYIVAFSLATPLATGLTYAVLTSFTSFSAILPGLTLLFSGGTFLFVATNLFSSHSTSSKLPVVLGLVFPLIWSLLLPHEH